MAPRPWLPAAEGDFPARTGRCPVGSLYSPQTLHPGVGARAIRGLFGMVHQNTQALALLAAALQRQPVNPLDFMTGRQDLLGQGLAATQVDQQVAKGRINRLQVLPGLPMQNLLETDANVLQTTQVIGGRHARPPSPRAALSADQRPPQGPRSTG